ncbi:MAG: T9SS C-terminal target domain-containing protein [Ignavibacteriae bacterium]|nr:MAG: T9SS C-terminal target domain-containing protein [Ignavibacteriota bacterium]
MNNNAIHGRYRKLQLPLSKYQKEDIMKFNLSSYSFSTSRGNSLTAPGNLYLMAHRTNSSPFRRNLILSVPTVVLLIILSLPAASQGSFYWKGIAPANGWDYPQNWAPQGIPGPFDKVTIDNDTVALSIPIIGRTIKDLTFLKGSINNGPLTINDTLDWFGGSAACPITVKGAWNVKRHIWLGSNITTMGTWNINDTVSGSSTITNYGTAVMSGIASFDLVRGTIENKGGSTFLIHNDCTFNAMYGLFVIDTGAVVRKSGATGTTVFRDNSSSGNLYGVVVTNYGLIDVQSGTLRFDHAVNGNGTFHADSGGFMLFAFGAWGYGTNSFRDGTRFSGSGVCKIIAGISLLDSVISENLEISGGGNNSPSTVFGTVRWTGGTLSDFTIGTNSTLLLDGPGEKWTGSGYIRCHGTMRWLGSGVIHDGNGNLEIMPGGLFDIQNDALIDGRGEIHIDSGGVLRKSVSTGLTSFQIGWITNNGALDIRNGKVSFGSDYRCSSGTVTSLRMGDTIAEFGSEPLTIGGKAFLDGTVNITVSPGYAPIHGTRFSCITYNSVSGTFRNVSSSMQGDFSIVPLYDGQHFVLSFPALDAPMTIDGMKDNFYSSLTGPYNGYLQIRSYAYNNNGKPVDDADISVHLWAAWDSKWFYLYEEVKDDTVSGNANNLWEEDCIELYFDPQPADSVINSNWGTCLTALGKGTPGVITADSMKNVPDTLKRWSRRMIPGGYALELAIGWPAIKNGNEAIAPWIGTTFGLAINQHDNDGKARRQATVQWAAVLKDSVYNTSKYLGTVHLLPDNKLEFQARNNMTGATNRIPYDGSEYVRTAIDEAFNASPNEFRLFQNYPNPFNPNTEIRYQIPEAGHVLLQVYDLLGREAATLVNEELPAGTHRVMWHADKASSGVYFYRLNTGAYYDTRRLLLLK